MTIKQSVINTFERIGFDYKVFVDLKSPVTVQNRFSGEAVTTTPLIACLINWVYQTSDDYELGVSQVNLSDFDRIRYFILEQDSKAYMTTID